MPGFGWETKTSKTLPTGPCVIISIGLQKVRLPQLSFVVIGNSMASTKKILQKTFIIASGLAFLGMMTVPMLTVLRGNANQTEVPSQGAPQQPTAADLERLKEVAGGYEKVLQREPDNPNALQGLVEARLQMGDLAGAIAPMEKLTKIYPEEKGLKQLLEAIKLQVKNPQLPPPQNPLAPTDPKDEGGGTGGTPTPTQP